MILSRIAKFFNKPEVEKEKFLIHIKVTERNIKEGLSVESRQSGLSRVTRCPVARALEDAGFQDVQVGFITFNAGLRIGELPDWVGKRIEGFYSGGDLTPFEFDLEKP